MIEIAFLIELFAGNRKWQSYQTLEQHKKTSLSLGLIHFFAKQSGIFAKVGRYMPSNVKGLKAALEGICLPLEISSKCC